MENNIPNNTNAEANITGSTSNSLLDAPTSTNNPDGGASTNNSWWYDSNQVGNGERPEWFNANKYKTVAEQAKAYTELQKKFGGFTGAPDEYKVEVEGFQPDELFNKVAGIAKELNMSNEGFNKLFSAYLEHAKSTAEATNANNEAYKMAELTKLGINAEEKVKEIKTWVSNNFSPEEQALFKEFAISADAIKLIDKIRNMVSDKIVATQPQSVDDTTSYQETVEDKINALMRDPRYSTDSKYFDHAQKVIKQLLGE